MNIPEPQYVIEMFSLLSFTLSLYHNSHPHPHHRHSMLCLGCGPKHVLRMVGSLPVCSLRHDVNGLSNIVGQSHIWLIMVP